MKYFSFVFFLFISNHLFCQSTIKGYVSNKKGDSIEDVNITISKKNTIQITAFAVTDSKGFFEIKYNLQSDSVEVKISIVGFENTTKIVSNNSQYLKFILAEHNTELPTVIVKEKPIVQNGDTINYLVQSFADRQDRVIGDVIAKLPGIEIDESSGQIKFNGKAISHYYIDGLDLLENKYNIANRNIPSDLVDKVQILENHQDIKLFDSLNSLEPALNIKLKKKARNHFIGKAKIGAGAAPLLWDNEITGLQFNKAFQQISSYKNNNAGSILGNELSENITTQKVGDNKEKNIKEEIINTIAFTSPPVSSKRYIFNNTHVAYFNILKVLPNTAQLKLNLSYLNDNTASQNFFKSTYYLPGGQQINFTENNNRFINTNNLAGNIFYTVNKKNIYLKNAFKIKLDFTKETGTTENPANVLQNFKNPFYQYSNDFILHLPFRKKIISYSSKINYNRTPQVLDVEPGQFKEVFNQSVPYEKLIQNAILNNFNTDNNVSFFTKTGKLQQQIKIGSECVHKNLQTGIDKVFNQSVYQLNDSFKNNITWNNLRFYAANSTVIVMGKKKLEIVLPVELNVLQTDNKIYTSSLNRKNFFFNPSIDFDIPFSGAYTLGLSYNQQHTTGTLSQISTGYILNNYRNLNRNDSLLPLEKLQNLTLSSYYKNSISAIFSNISISISSTLKNIIFNQFYNGLFIKTSGIFLPNTQKSFMVNGSSSKYFIVQKINISLNYSYNFLQSDLLQQNELAKCNSKIFSVGFKVNYNKFSFAAFEANTHFDNFQNRIKQSSVITGLSSTNHLKQDLKIYFFTSKKSTLYFNNEFYKVWDNKNNKANYFFGDVGYKMKFKKADVEIEWSNFTNNKTYITINNAENLKQINTYKIRAANLMVKFYFSF